MNHIQSILQNHPKSAISIDASLLAECVQSCLQCVSVCTACADACLEEEMVAQLTQCIRTDLDCADVCAATASIFSRQSQPKMELVRAQLEACAVACKACGDSCAEHEDMHEHCRVCMACCRETEEVCNRVLQQMKQAA